MAKRNSDPNAARINRRIVQARRSGPASDTTRIPTNFETKYPITCAETKTAF